MDSRAQAAKYSTILFFHLICHYLENLINLFDTDTASKPVSLIVHSPSLYHCLPYIYTLIPSPEVSSHFHLIHIFLLSRTANTRLPMSTCDLDYAVSQILLPHLWLAASYQP